MIETSETDLLQCGIAAQRRIEYDPFGMDGRNGLALRARRRGSGGRVRLSFGGGHRLRSQEMVQNGSGPITVVRCIRRRSGNA